MEKIIYKKNDVCIYEEIPTNTEHKSLYGYYKIKNGKKKYGTRIGYLDKKVNNKEFLKRFLPILIEWGYLKDGTNKS